MNPGQLLTNEERKYLDELRKAKVSEINEKLKITTNQHERGLYEYLLKQLGVIDKSSL